MEFDRKKIFEMLQDMFSNVVKLYVKFGKENYFDFMLLFMKICLLAEILGFTIAEFQSDMFKKIADKMNDKRS